MAHWEAGQFAPRAVDQQRIPEGVRAARSQNTLDGAKRAVGAWYASYCGCPLDARNDATVLIYELACVSRTMPGEVEDAVAAVGRADPAGVHFGGEGRPGGGGGGGGFGLRTYDMRGHGAAGGFGRPGRDRGGDRGGGGGGGLSSASGRGAR